MLIDKDFGFSPDGKPFLDVWDNAPTLKSKLSPKEKAAYAATLYKEQDGRCNGCEKKLPKRNLTIDHKKPVSKGGTDRLSNLQLLCANCNAIKGNAKTQAQLKKSLRNKGILRPKVA